jgi:hypothetical protein
LPTKPEPDGCCLAIFLWVVTTPYKGCDYTSQVAQAGERLVTVQVPAKWKSTRAGHSGLLESSIAGYYENEQM